jgi:hypothetical protein
MGLSGEQLRHHAEALLDVRIGIISTITRVPDSKFKGQAWVGLERLDRVLDDLLPFLDPEWAVTEYIEYRPSPENIPNSPAEWTDAPEPPPPRPRGSRDW